MFCQSQAFPLIKKVRFCQAFHTSKKKPKVLKKARISKPGFKKAKLATLQYCEQYIGNIVLLWYNNNVLLNCTIMNNKWRNNYQYFLFRYLQATSCTTNWPNCSLNAARWCKKFHNDASTYRSKKSFSLKNEEPSRNRKNSRNPTTCFAEP